LGPTIFYSKPWRVGKFVIKPSFAGGVDIYIFPIAQVVHRVCDDTPREYLVWHLVARAFGKSIASDDVCTNVHAVRISFMMALSRRKLFFFVPAFRERAKGTVAMFQRLSDCSAGRWRIVESRPVGKTDITVCVISSLTDRKAESDSMSLVSFVNSISTIDVKRTHDGVKRRGVMVKA
jgi:hypothetical protein